ncbi:MAG: YifB family Mg chelatase-like AAA ATPase [Lachnospiraceae bacterium]|nr:YifB family Mg chelatase-like AAA ATPase [Lachnospiraceae bacterium]
MFGKILSADVRGIDGFGVSVEVDISDGMPIFLMVGYLASEVREAGDRVRTALRNCGILLPPKRITVNLAPANVRKAGSKFDLPIAVALLAALGLFDPRDLEGVLMAGELSLNGEIHGIPGILPMVETARNMGCTCCVVPLENLKEAALVTGIQVLGATHLKELLPAAGNNDCFSALHAVKEEPVNPGFLEEPSYGVDFSEINGQETVKRAAQVAVAGMHNFLMIGPPGAGKTMIAKRIPTILPPLTLEESLELSKIYSIAGLLQEKEPLIRERPFRAPHHTITPAALTGGGRIPMPGEISLGTNGVLFLDELPEFQKIALEVLRQPLEEGEVRICRSYGTYVYPARFMLVAAMNPCSCGYYPDFNLCSCGTKEVSRYLGRLSQPLLDRIDICVEAPRLSYEELVGREKKETSTQIRRRMERVHKLQQERYAGSPYRFNSDLGSKGIERFCHLGHKEEELLRNAFHKLHLSARACHRIMKVARTIADLEEEVYIGRDHLMEAICYRALDKKYWTR